MPCPLTPELSSLDGRRAEMSRMAVMLAPSGVADCSTRLKLLFDSRHRSAGREDSMSSRLPTSRCNAPEHDAHATNPHD